MRRYNGYVHTKSQHVCNQTGLKQNLLHNLQYTTRK